MQFLLSFIKWLSAITTDSSLTSHGSGHELNVKQTTHLTFKLADVIKTVVDFACAWARVDWLISVKSERRDF